jgi:TM2 domain-containing membrane protein YozV
MTQDETIYDLGEIERDKPSAIFGKLPEVARAVSRQREAQPEAAGVGPALAGSLSMFVPGLGQMFTGELAWGLFYLSGIGFCAASVWALVASLDRLIPTLRLLDVPVEFLIVAVFSLAGFGVALHLSAIVHAQCLGAGARGHAAPHPIVAGLASLLIPGWGQILAGHRRRAVLFLGAVWLLGAAWTLVTPAGAHALARASLAMPAAVRDDWGPVVMLSAPLVLWAIAIYDAAAGAAAERRG